MLNLKFSKNPLFKTGAIYGTASLLKSGAGMIASIIMIRWLEPEQIGLWQSLAVVTAYTSFVQLGVNQGLNRELPFSYGQGNFERGKELAQTAQAYNFGISLVFFLATITVTAVLLLFSKPIPLVAGVLTLGFMISINTFNNFLVVTFRSAKAFDNLANVFFIDTFLILGLLPSIYFFNYYGLLVYNFFSAFFLNVLMFYFRPLKIKNAFKTKNAIYLIRTGVPIFGMGYIRNVARSFVRLVLLNAGGVRLVGLFAPASAVSNVMTLFPTIFANFFYPQMTYRYGKSGDPKALWPAVLKTYFILFTVSIPMVIAIWVITPGLITNYFPKYQESIRAMQIMALSLCFSGGIITHNIFYSIKAYKYSYFYTFVELGLYALLPWTLIQLLPNMLTSISLSVFIINVFTFFLNFFLLRHALFNPKYMSVSNGPH